MAILAAFGWGWHHWALTLAYHNVILTHLRIHIRIFANHNTFNRGRAQLNLAVGGFMVEIGFQGPRQGGIRDSEIRRRISPHSMGVVAPQYTDLPRPACSSGGIPRVFSAVLIMEELPEGSPLAAVELRAAFISRRRGFHGGGR